METISIINLKGGAGKTTTAFNFAEALKKMGYSVLLIDTDYQRNLTTLKKHDKDTNTIFDIFTGSKEINDVIRNDFIASSEKLVNLDALLQNQIGAQFILKEALQQVKKKYDYCIIDNHCIINTISINTLTASNKIICTATPNKADFEGFQKLITMVNDIKRHKLNEGLKIDGVLMTRYSNRTILNKQLKTLFENQAKIIDSKVYNSFIRENISIRESQAQNESVFDYNDKSNGAIDYMEFVKEFLKKVDKR